jgi:transposase
LPQEHYGRRAVGCRSAPAKRAAAPAPSHPDCARAPGPKLLAHILFAKFGLHLPFNRQSAVYAREGIDLYVRRSPTGGPAAVRWIPLVEAIRAHVFAARAHIHDDTTMLGGQREV